MPGKVFAYLRVSTQDQVLDRQMDAIEAYAKAHGLTIDRVFEEKASGKSTATRPELNRMLEQLREGDTVIVNDLSRLSRSVRDTLRLAEDVFQAQGVNLVSIRESIDTTTPMGRFAISLFAGLNQMEREQTAERTKQALEARRKRGAQLGRPKKDPNAIARALELHAEGKLSIKEIEQATGVSKSVMYKHLHAMK